MTVVPARPLAEEDLPPDLATDASEPGREPAPAPTRRARLREAARFAAPALALYAAVRAISLLVLVVWGHEKGMPALHKLASLWDAGWYVKIANHGYDHALPAHAIVNGHHQYTNLAFFPVYPALIKVFHTLLPFLTAQRVALLIAWAGALVAAWGIFAVAAVRYGRRTGIIAAVLWAVLPHAAIENMAYTEPVFTALAAWALYAAVTRRWVWAGVLAILAGLTRPSGVAVAAAVSIGALAELIRLLVRRRNDPAAGEELSRTWWRTGLGALLAPLGWLGFVAWVGLRLGRWNGYFDVQMLWNSHFDGGRSTGHDLRTLFVHAQPVPLGKMMVAAVLFSVVVLFALSLVHRQALPLLVFSGLILLIALGDAAYFSSRARFLLPAFPLLFPVATALTRIRDRASLTILLSAATAFTAVYGGYLVYVYPYAP